MSSKIDQNVLELEVARLKTLPIVKDVLIQLKTNLPNDLYYHSYTHTLNVIDEVVRFALHDHLPAREVELLAIGAAFHDLGFIEKRQDNEWLSASKAREAMKAEGSYQEAEIQLVETMILDTQLVETSLGAKQIPTDQLGCYLLDADLGNLGREDFFEKAELLRQELGLAKPLFFKDAFRLIKNHKWQTNAARELRSEGQQRNIKELELFLEKLDLESEHSSKSKEGLGDSGLELSHLLLLSRLPILLNSSLNTERLVKTALEHLKMGLGAAAATVFQLNESGSQLTFWALSGNDKKLSNKVIPADRGIVGWVIKERQGVVINDPKRDKRFYNAIDKESEFNTVNLVCVPLVVRSNKIIGALQVLNKKDPAGFTAADLLLADRFANQLALAIDNSVLYEQSELMRGKLAHLDKRKSEMITVLTHEIRTPLNVISGAAEVLGSSQDMPQDVRDNMAQALNRGVLRLVNLSQQLHSLSQVQGNDVSIKKENFPIKNLLSAIEDRFRPIAKTREIDFKIDLKNSDGFITGDESLLYLVLTNLVSNAIRFTPNKGSVEVKVNYEYELAEIIVSDTGIGIEQSEMDKIFEKFYEVGSALVHSSGDYEFKSGGLGLGLSAVKSILKAHGSDITVESKLGEGSKFSFRLPYVNHDKN